MNKAVLTLGTAFFMFLNLKIRLNIQRVYKENYQHIDLTTLIL